MNKTRKPRMTATEKVFYRSTFADIKAGRRISDAVRAYWLVIHTTKTY
jgi:hypothetical protein